MRKVALFLLLLSVVSIFLLLQACTEQEPLQEDTSASMPEPVPEPEIVSEPEPEKEPEPEPIPGSELRVVTFNVRFDGGGGENHPLKRKARVIAFFEKYEPDLIGVQEADATWARTVSETCAVGYARVGKGRDVGNAGDTTSILYKTEKFELLDSGTFWLSETPDKVSKSWDSQDNRVCSWVRLKIIETGETLAYFNTHLDHVGEQARQNGLKLILSKITEYVPDEQVIITGDFNTSEGSAVYNIINDRYYDAKEIADDSDTGGTFNNFTESAIYDTPLDYCFVSQGIKVSKYQIMKDQNKTGMMSDHYPVMCDIRLKKRVTE